MLPEDITPLAGHLFSCSFLVLLSLGEKEEEKKGGLTMYALHPYKLCFVFIKKGCGCEIKVGEAVKCPKSKACRFLTAVGRAGVVGELQTTNSPKT